ncbi:MAG: prepilin-type N-terminal cleavage/methylation domain-containing protein [Candidatus Hydrogenedens sp.]|nr:prepilin-type N-terminal cleavage/methylation domain-containing protein [Candidatus Hydrogenedens sp.]
MKPRKHTRAGITLLELMVVMAVFGSMLGMGMKLLFTAQRLSAVSLLAHERLEEARTFDAALRDIIQRASGFAEAAGDYRAEDETLVLRMAEVDGGDLRAVIGRVPETQRPFIAMLRQSDGAWQAERFQVFPLPLSGLRFQADAQANLVRCRYSLALEPGERKPAEIPVLTTWAALRGKHTGAAP